MVARTAKFVGTAYSLGTSVTVEVQYNNNVVYSGTLPATTQDPLPWQQPITDPDWEGELFNFTTDTDLTGEIPMSITVTGGTLFFGHLYMNYCGNHVWEPDPQNPRRGNIVAVPPVDFWGDPNENTIETDGISNLKKNGSTWDWRIDVGDQLGDWAYPIRDAEVVTFDFFVDPTKVVVDPYVPPV